LALIVALGASASAAAQPSIASAILPAAGLDAGDAFGRRAALSGSLLVVGANGDDEKGEDSGAAYVFEHMPDGRWTQRAKLTGALQRAGDYAGWSVAIDGDTAVVGAPGDDRDPQGQPNATTANRGAAYVFRRTAGGWVEEARFQPAEVQAGHEFGGRVAVSGDTVLVSAFYYDLPTQFFGAVPQAGAVWVYRRTAAGWSLEGVLADPPSFPVPDRRFGFSLDIEGDVAVVGEPGAGSGAVIEFRRNGTSWTVVGRVEPKTFASIDGVGSAARFASVRGMVTDPTGGTLVLEEGPEAATLRVRRIANDGAVSTVVTRTASSIAGSGTDLLARSPAGDLFIATTAATTGRSAILRRAADGTESLLATDLPLVAALESDGAGGVFVAASTAVDHLSSSGTLTRVAGTVDGAAIVDGSGAAARFKSIAAMARAATGDLLVIDAATIRRLAPGTGTVSVVAGADVFSLLPVDGQGANARFVVPRCLTVVDTGEVYLVDGTTIRRMSPTFAVTTIAGASSSDSQLVDGVGPEARLSSPATITADTAGDGVAFADTGTVRTVRAAGVVRTLAGLPMTGRGIAASAALYGYSLDLQAGRLVIGAPGEPALLTAADGAGIAWVFQRTTAGNWDLGMPLNVPMPQATTRYGEAVSVTRDGDVILGAANGCTWVAPGQCVDGSAGTALDGVVSAPALFRRNANGLWTQRLLLAGPDTTPKAGFGSVLASSGHVVVAGEPASDPGSGTVLGNGRIVVFDLDTLDLDGDTLPDLWESTFGLDAESPTGANGRDGDPDADGLTNGEELAAQSHPRNLGSATRYFAEGATSAFFETRLALANAGTEPARVLLRFLLADGTLRSTALQVPAHQSRKLAISQVPGLAVAEFSTVLETDQPVVAERQMWWSAATAYGTHGERAIGTVALTWYLAEGATHSGFDLFYLLQNPNPVESLVRVRYLRPSGAPLEKTYALPPNSRTNIWVDVETFNGRPELASTDVSAVFEVQNGQPIIVERAMYLTRATQAQGGVFEAGHESAGVTAGAAEWFLAEGATGDYFDMFVLVANPTTTPAMVEATYLLPDGSNLVKSYEVAPASRFNIWVDLEHPRLADTAVSLTLRSVTGVPIIVERSMWWPGPTAATWTEAHNSPGGTENGTRWGIGDGVVQDRPATADTYVLIANVGARDAQVRVTLLYDDGGAAESREFAVSARSRFNVDVRSEFPSALGRGFGAIVESLSGDPIVVERAIYNDALGIRWAAGNNALGTRLQ
jgi:hypothetical protein